MLLFLLLALGAAGVSWSIWREVDDPLGGGGYDEAVSATLGRSWFMAIAGVIVEIFSAVLILAQ